jgi:glycosyltransferase involved in cell wall biosynthesis
VTSSVTAEAFLTGQLRTVAQDARVSLVVGDAVPAVLVESEGVAGLSIGLPRRPSLAADLRGLLRLVVLLRPDVAVFGTPKMGLLAAVACWACRVPRRIYVLHGLRWEGLHGWRRAALRGLDRLACRLSTDVVAVSGSVREIARRQLGVAPGKVRVVHHGSANGIDVDRFAPVPASDRGRVREELGLPPDAVLFTVAGRITRDKGVQDLPAVWERIGAALPEAHLVVVGQLEPAETADTDAVDRLRAMSGVSLWAATDRMERLLGVADVNLSLSRREGMPTVVLEAAACEVPTVGFAVTGVVDAIEQGTGVLVPLGDLDGFADEAIRLGREPSTRRRRGEAARRRVRRDFDPDAVWRGWRELVVAEQAHA